MDKFENTILFSIFGNFLFMIVFSFIGPLPFMPFEPHQLLIKVDFGYTSIQINLPFLTHFSF